MPNKNSYTSMKNHQVLNNHPNETEADKCKWCNKHKFPLSNSYKKKKKKKIKPILTIAMLDTIKTVTLAHVRQYLKIVSGIIKSSSPTINIKMWVNY